MVVDVTLHGNSCLKQHLHGEETAGPSTHSPIPWEGPLRLLHDPGEGVLRGWTDTHGLGPAMAVGVRACEQRPLGGPLLSTLQDAGKRVV